MMDMVNDFENSAVDTTSLINEKKNNEKTPKKEKTHRFSFAFSRKQLCIPYAVFLSCFVIFPLLLIVYYAFTSRSGAFSFESFVKFFTDVDSLRVLGRSILLGLASTLLCLLIGYPVAYILSRIKSNRRTIFLLLFIMPMWINFVLRATAMRELLTILGLYGSETAFSKTLFANYLNVIIGMVYDYLPFVILPIYSVLIKLDKNLEEAANDLGANGFGVFAKVTFPLSMAGVISAATMVFLPSMTSYVISNTFGGGQVTIIGGSIDDAFRYDDWNVGSVMALILLVIMFFSTLLTGGFSKDTNARRTDL